ncbi:MAG: TolC family protein [Acidimicrobiia bacterium]|nr:TolC family protein [Acidimicrobiia bacterium]
MTIRLWTYAVATVLAGALCPTDSRADEPVGEPRPARVQDGQSHHGAREDAVPLSLDAALSEALERNPSLAALRARFEAARLGPDRERFLMPPTLEAQIWQWPVNTLNPLDTNMFMLSVGQEIPGRGKRALRAALAASEAALDENAIAVRAREVIEEVKSTYAALYVARQEAGLYRRSVDLLRQFARISEAKYAAGRISQQDVLKAVVELSSLHEDLIDVDEQTLRLEAHINALLDRPPGAPVGELMRPRDRVSLPPVEVLERVALDRHPELRTAGLGRERAEAELAVARQAFTPDFMIGGGYMAMPGDRDAWSARVTVSWPRAPWSRGGLEARVAETTAQVAVARAEQRVVASAIRQAVHHAYLRVEAAADRAELLRTTILPQSSQTLEVSRVAYQADRGDFLALIDSQRVLLETERSHVRALGDLEQALADLEWSVGADLDPFLAEAAAHAAANGTTMREGVVSR